MEAIQALTAGELVSAARGHRDLNALPADLLAAVALGDWETAGRLTNVIDDSGALHLMAKRGDLAAVTWLLDHGADPDARWNHWGAAVTPLHVAAMQGHDAIVRLLLEREADRHIRDSTHDSDPAGWAEFFERPEIVAILRA